MSRGDETGSQQQKQHLVHTEFRSVKGADSLATLYKIGGVLGTGASGLVRHAIDRRTGEEVAVKIIKEPEESNGQQVSSTVKQEIFVLRRVSHENIMSLRDVFFQNNTYFIVTELCLGGDLLTEMLDHGGYREDEARLVFLGIAQGLQHIHQHNLAHRDIKLENILLARKGDRTTVKIADFGLSARTMGRRLHSMTGSTLYVAPEIIRCRNRPGVWYDERVDVWSLGVCLYILLSGRPPFDHPDMEEHFRCIVAGNVDFPARDFVGVSIEAKDLIRKCLTVDPADRITVSELFRHPFLEDVLFMNALSPERAKAHADSSSPWGGGGRARARSGERAHRRLSAGATAVSPEQREGLAALAASGGPGPELLGRRASNGNTAVGVVRRSFQPAAVQMPHAGQEGMDTPPGIPAIRTSVPPEHHLLGSAAGPGTPLGTPLNRIPERRNEDSNRSSSSASWASDGSQDMSVSPPFSQSSREEATNNSRGGRAGEAGMDHSGGSETESDWPFPEPAVSAGHARHDYQHQHQQAPPSLSSSRGGNPREFLSALSARSRAHHAHGGSPKVGQLPSRMSADHFAAGMDWEGGVGAMVGGYGDFSPGSSDEISIEAAVRLQPGDSPPLAPSTPRGQPGRFNTSRSRLSAGGRAGMPARGSGAGFRTTRVISGSGDTQPHFRGMSADRRAMSCNVSEYLQ